MVCHWATVRRRRRLPYGPGAKSFVVSDDRGRPPNPLVEVSEPIPDARSVEYLKTTFVAIARAGVAVEEARGCQ